MSLMHIVVQARPCQVNNYRVTDHRLLRASSRERGSWRQTWCAARLAVPESGIRKSRRLCKTNTVFILKVIWSLLLLLVIPHGAITLGEQSVICNCSDQRWFFFSVAFFGGINFLVEIVTGKYSATHCLCFSMLLLWNVYTCIWS